VLPDDVKRLYNSVLNHRVILSVEGRLLLIPMILLFAGLILFALVKLWPILKSQIFGVRGFMNALLEKLRSGLGFAKEGEEPEDKPDRKDLLRTLETIKGLAPREAILASYECLRGFLDLLGYTRPDDNTPYEILRSLPRRFEFLKAPAASLTDLYVAEAYGSRPATPEDSRKALESLLEVKQQVEAYAKDSMSR